MREYKFDHSSGFIDLIFLKSLFRSFYFAVDIAATTCNFLFACLRCYLEKKFFKIKFTGYLC